MQEIERKFLIKGNYKPFVKKSVKIKQGYLSSVPEKIVRVRIIGDKAFLTIKGIPNKSGTKRFEWEIEITPDEAEKLLVLCKPEIIEKTRHYIGMGKHTYEIDEFSGDNEGLVIAEIELQAEDEEFEKPAWLGDEVTGNIKFYNSMLIKNPYKKWKK
jgi:adenylate cyclase